tara:strand:+ start:1183 stop:2055 length:873 start_codon:yes stop_codon:yes gene_type:complete
MSISLDNFPEKYDRAVVLFASAKMCLHNLKLALASDIGLTTAPSMGALESVTTPLISLDLTNIPEWDSLNLPIAPLPPEISNVTVDTFNSIDDYNIPIMSTPDYSDANNWINEEEDSEMLSSRMAVISAQIQQYSAEVNQASAEFNSNNIKYQADVQKKLKNADLAMTEENQKLQKYSAELQEYSASIQAETVFSQNKNAEVAQKFQEAVQNTQSAIAAYQSESADVSQKNQVTLGKYSADLNRYGAQLQEKANNYNWNIQQYTVLKNEYVEIFGIPQSQQQAKQQKGGN